MGNWKNPGHIISAFILVLVGLPNLCSSQASTCSGTVQLTSYYHENLLASHANFSQTNLPHGSACNWQLSTNSGSRIAINITYIEPDNTNDRVILYDDASSSTVLARINSTQATLASPLFISSSNILTVNYLGSTSGQHRGFQLKYYSIPSDGTPIRTCTSIIYNDPPTNTRGILMSHQRYLTAPYPTSMSCSWTLPAQSGKVIQFLFFNMSLGDGDCVRLVNLTALGGSQYTYCGWIAKMSTSLRMGESLRIEFTSDAKFESTGFLFQFWYITASFCPASGNITGDTGQILSHNEFGTENYQEEMSCTWQITASAGLQIMFWFTFLETELNYDKIYVYDLDNGLTIINGLTGGTGDVASPHVYETQASSLRVQFVTDKTAHFRGFRLQYNASQYYCTGFQSVFTSDSTPRTIVSHYKAGNISMPSNHRCYWQLATLPGTFRIAVNVTYLEPDNPNDKLVLFDGFNNTGALATVNSTFASGSSSPIIVSSDNVMTLFFSASLNGYHRGFRLTYYSVAKRYDTGCSSVKYADPTNSSGIVTSHEGFDSIPYSPDTSCSWDLQEQFGKYIQLTVVNVSLGDGDCVRLINGTSVGIIGTYCGWIARFGLNFVMGGSARIEFSSNSRLESSGFLIRFQYIAYSCAPINYQSNTSGYIVSHLGQGVSAYSPGASCSWTIPHRANLTYTTLTMSSVQLGPGDCLSLTGNLITGSTSITTYCDSVINYSPISLVMSGPVQVNFTANLVAESFGFMIRFAQYQSTCGSAESWTADTGEVQSHIGVGAGTVRYLANMDCSWQISVSPGKQIIAWFTYLNLSDLNDSVTLVDSSSASLVTVQGGYSSYTVFQGHIASSNMMRVKFATDSSGVAFGFKLQYSVADNFCTTPLNLFNSGEIVSPRLGVNGSHYLNNMLCSWLITAPSDSNVLVRFTMLRLDADSSDNVTLYTEMGVPSIIASLNGLSNVSSSTFVSGSNQMRVIFATDSVGTSLGFRLQYITNESYCRGAKYLTSSSGELQSHSGLGRLTLIPSMTCSWVIEVPLNQRVVARFSYVSLTGAADSLTLYDGTAEDASRILTRLSSNFSSSYSDSSSPFKTSGRVMKVVFSTGSTTASPGFRMVYNATETISTLEPTSTQSGPVTIPELTTLNLYVIIAVSVAGPLLLAGLVGTIGYFIHKNRVKAVARKFNADNHYKNGTTTTIGTTESELDNCGYIQPQRPDSDEYDYIDLAADKIPSEDGSDEYDNPDPIT